ncbi:MAG: FtsX-like permease family protein [Planctomycetes bacterium]|nr:FtsX-like permease family protein [Planctomycetota bacterium]
MLRLAWRYLIDDRVRLSVTLVGVTFAVVLMLVQRGFYLAFLESVSAVIDHCPADVWIVSKNALNNATARPFSEEEIYRVKGTPGIAWAERMVFGIGNLKLKDGANQWAQVIGFNPQSGVGGPWEILQGKVADLKKPGTYFIDESSLAQIPGLKVGDALENMDQRMEVVGLSRGLRSYTTYPTLFASVRTVQEQCPGLDERLNYVVAKFAGGADRETTLRRLRRLRNCDVYTREAFSDKVRAYWAGKTGIGVGITVTIAIGFLVGLVVVAQTMYAATMERLREYATLKSLGASNLSISGMIWLQALLVALAGYALGAAVTLVVKSGQFGHLMALELPPSMLAGTLVGTIVLCLGASMLSVVRVMRVDPALVFKA